MPNRNVGLRALQVCFLAMVFCSGALDLRAADRLLGFPDLGRDVVVFTYGGDLWSVAREGGRARRLTADPGRELFAKISPDGKTLAYTAQYDGGFQVYTMPIEGGPPRRLTFISDPAEAGSWGMPDNIVIDWLPDRPSGGMEILFLSRRTTYSEAVSELYTVSCSGGLPRRFRIARAGLLAVAPGGRRVACNFRLAAFQHWRGYRGGLAPDIWLCDLDSLATERLTDWEGTDSSPVWCGGTIYFTSDRGPNNRLNLYALDPESRDLHAVTHFDDFDVLWPSAGPGGLVFEKGGLLYLMEESSEEIRRLSVTVPAECLETRPRQVNVSESVSAFDLSPGGGNMVVTARGDLFAAPVAGGAIIDLTRSSDVREKDATISPDGKQVAYVTDRYGRDGIGEDEIAVRPIDGTRREERVTHDGSGFRSKPLWSPDGGNILFAQAPSTLAYAEVSSGETRVIDQAEYGPITDYDWSPDGLWVAYAKPQENSFSSIFLYSLEDETVTAVTGPETDDGEPVFDAQGRDLFFLTRCPQNALVDELDDAFAFGGMTRIALVTLRTDVAPPGAMGLPIQPDREPDGFEDQEEEEDDVREESGWSEGSLIEPEGIAERIVLLPMESAAIDRLQAGSDALFFVVRPLQGSAGPWGTGRSVLHRFDLDAGVDTEVTRGVEDYAVSMSGSLLSRGEDGTWQIVDAAGDPEEHAAGTTGLEVDLSGLRMRLDPRAEWHQIFAEVWRIQRDFFVDPQATGDSWRLARLLYEPLLEDLSTRADLDIVLGWLLAELGSSHIEVWGNEPPQADIRPASMLGCDFELDEESRLYRIAHIYRGDPRDPRVRGPLAVPGLGVAEGDYLLAIDGVDVGPPASPYRIASSCLMASSDPADDGPGPVRLSVSSYPDGREARDVWVRPVTSELALRAFEERERRRRRVDEASDGRIGYIWLTEMEGVGLVEFARGFYPQARRAGLILDLRDNGGGYIDRMILDRLAHAPAATEKGRHTPCGPVPEMAFHGKMVCLVNENSSSDAEYFAYFFRRLGLGIVIGTRTWGGARALQDDFTLVDGGGVTVPQFERYDLEGHRLIENQGVAPDLVVESLPADLAAGRDPVLEKALLWLLDRLDPKPEETDAPAGGRSPEH